MKTTRSAQQRHRQRIGRLQSLLNEDGENIDVQTAWARHTIWQKHHQPPLVRVRAGLVLRDERESSPLRDVSASKSAAVQLLLLSIFENQCRPEGPGGSRTPVPLWEADARSETAWRYLISLPITDRRGERTQARPPTENREKQIKNALERLGVSKRIELHSTPKRSRNS